MKMIKLLSKWLVEIGEYFEIKINQIVLKQSREIAKWQER